MGAARDHLPVAVHPVPRIATPCADHPPAHRADPPSAPWSTARRIVDCRAVGQCASCRGRRWAVPGHWDGDLIIGKPGRSVVATLVERHSRFVQCSSCGFSGAHRSVSARRVDLRRSEPAGHVVALAGLGLEDLAQHATFTIDTGVQIHFCDPSSPWQRGSNENSNGLLQPVPPRSHRPVRPRPYTPRRRRR